MASLPPDDDHPIPAQPITPGPSLRRSSWRGAKTGMRWASYIAGPIAAVMANLCLALTAFAAGFDPDAPPAPIAPWGRLMFDHQQAAGLDWTNKLVAIARQPHPDRPALIEAWEAEVDRVRLSRFAPWTTTLPLLMMPSFSATASAESRYHGQLGSMAILLAAERHRRKLGDWPGSIAAIDPSVLPGAPVDPYTGQAFRMERRDGQWLIYSVGPNRKDEHGVVDPAHWLKGGPDDYGTGAWDVAFRRQATRPEVDHVALP